MNIGAITDSLGALSFDELLGTAAELGIERSEFVAGRWSKRAARRDCFGQSAISEAATRRL
jgi:hypothetical protein